MEPPMIVELCDIRIHPGQNATFEEAIQRASSGAAIYYFKKYKGQRVLSKTSFRFSAVHG
jgi:hypothetical protein